MKSTTSILSAAVLAVILALPLARATAATVPGSEVTKSMQEAKAAAYQLSEKADRLHSITSAGDHSWQSHSSYLHSAREDVNQLGEMLSNLEGLKPGATPTQQMGIERMRPQLVQTANALTDAIELLNDRRHHVYFPEYREAVQSVSQQATSMHQTLDAVLDYESAKARLDSLELAQSGS
jgi:chromosome segregation ATPase